MSKLTAEGVTLMGKHAAWILEEVLPRKFGGSAIDYQFMEGDAEDGLTRLTLLVAPRVALPSESEVIATVLQSLGGDSGAAYVRSLWSQGQTIKIKRQDPVLTERGKLLPIVRADADRNPAP